MSKKMSFVLVCCACTLILSSCKVDVNEIASRAENAKSSSAASSSQSETDSDMDTQTDMFYETETDSDKQTDSDAQSDTDSDTEIIAFDESKYPVMYATGSAEITLTADALSVSKSIGSVKCGDKLSVVRQDVMEYTFVHSALLDKFGYVKTIYLASSADETCYGEVMYVKPAQAALYKDEMLSEKVLEVSQNDMITVIVKGKNGVWRVTDKNGTAGYIDHNLLSDKKVKVTSSSSKSSSKSSGKSSSKNSSSSSSKSSEKSSSKAASSSTSASSEAQSSSAVSSEESSKPSSAEESKEESKASSKDESSKASSKSDSSEKSSDPDTEETVSALFTGKGEAPTDNYTVYIVDVDEGYLSLRNAPSQTKSKVIGELYYQEEVYVIDTNGDYWYVYAPNSGMYGYVTGNPDYLYPEYY